MKAIYFILIFGLIYCKTTPTQVFDLYYNYEYSLQKDLGLDYTLYAFRLPVNYVGEMDFEIKILENDYQTFYLYVCEYQEYQSDNMILNDNYVTPLTRRGDYKEGDYRVYSFAFSAYAGTTYFSIKLVLDNYSMNYTIVRV